MTDGDVTEGEKTPNELKKHLHPLVSNIFIGFGIDHNAYLLKEFGANTSINNYYFVDELEKAGFVYGEILHSIIYRILENTTIQVTNGLIYDWKKNTWLDKIDVGDLVSETNKTFHILSDNPTMFSCNIEAVDCSSKKIVSVSLTKKDACVDFNEYKYRQRVQELLFEVNVHNFGYSEIIGNMRKIDDYEDYYRKIHETGKVLKERMKILLDDLMTQSEKSKMMKMLCDDVYVCLQTFESKHGAMFSCARQVSQGAQRSYSATYTSKASKPPQVNTMFRSHAFDYQLDQYGNNRCSQDLLEQEEQEELEELEKIAGFHLRSHLPNFDYDSITQNQTDFDSINLSLQKPISNSNSNSNFTQEFVNDNFCKVDGVDGVYEVSDQIDNPYSTLSVLKLMRSCSANIDENCLFK
jgi:hypothetical protein